MATKTYTRRQAIAGALLGGTALSLGITGCAPGGQSQDQEPEPSASSGGPPAPKTLTWWDYSQPGPGVTALAALLDQYHSSNPSITINRQYVPYDDLKKRLLQAAGARSLPDIVVINDPDHAQFADAGIAADITAQADTWGQVDKYPKGLIASCQYKDKLYGLPQTANCLAIFYNKEALSSIGAKPPTDWASLRKTAKDLTKKGRYGFAYSAINNQQAVFQWLPTLWQAGGDLTDIASADSIRALDFWNDLMKDGSVSKEALTWDQAAVNTEFAEERAAMMINGPWQIPVLQQSAPKLEYGVSLLPTDKEEATCLGGENYFIVNGPNEAASWDVLQWLQDLSRLESLAKGEGSLPVRTDQKPFSDSDAIALFSKQLLVARPRAYGPNYEEIADHVVDALQAVLSGSSSADAALKKAATTIEPLLP